MVVRNTSFCKIGPVSCSINSLLELWARRYSPLYPSLVSCCCLHASYAKCSGCKFSPLTMKPCMQQRQYWARCHVHFIWGIQTIKMTWNWNISQHWNSISAVSNPKGTQEVTMTAYLVYKPTYSYVRIPVYRHWPTVSLVCKPTYSYVRSPPNKVGKKVDRSN